MFSESRPQTTHSQTIKVHDAQKLSQNGNLSNLISRLCTISMSAPAFISPPNMFIATVSLQGWH